jgi:hypothetical protein
MLRAKNVLHLNAAAAAAAAAAAKLSAAAHTNHCLQVAAATCTFAPCCNSLQAHHSLSPESVLVNPACQLFWLIAAMAAAELLVILPNPATGLAWSENSDAPYCDLPADADQSWEQTGWLGFGQVV